MKSRMTASRVALILIGGLILSTTCLAIDWRYYDRGTRDEHLGGWDIKSRILENCVDGATWAPDTGNTYVQVYGLEPVGEVFVSVLKDLMELKEWVKEEDIDLTRTDKATKDLKLRYDRQAYLQIGAFWAIEVLGQIRYKPASGLLAEVARNSPYSRHFCDRAAEAVIRIGDTNMFDFATEVVCSTGTLGKCAGDDIFLELGAYLGFAAKAWDPVPAGSVERDVPLEVDPLTRTRSNVVQFLMDALTSHPTRWQNCIADERLCLTCPEWAKSREREDFLRAASLIEVTHLGQEKLVARAKKEITLLQSLPASERTHVDVHPLRGPAPDLSVTNGPLAPAVEAILKETPSPAPPSAVTNAP